VRTIVPGLMLTAALVMPAQAERLAFSCKGKELMGIGPAGVGLAGGGKAEKAIFVVDDEARTVGRYQKDGTLEDVCVFHLTCDRSFSAARIAIHGGDYMGTGTSVRFDWDRGTGALDIRYVLRMENGNLMASRSTLNCVPAPMPKLKA